MANETAKIGIFFKVGNDFLIDDVSLANAEPCGDLAGIMITTKDISPLHPPNTDSRRMNTTIAPVAV